MGFLFLRLGKDAGSFIFVVGEGRWFFYSCNWGREGGFLLVVLEEHLFFYSCCQEKALTFLLLRLGKGVGSFLSYWWEIN